MCVLVLRVSGSLQPATSSVDVVPQSQTDGGCCDDLAVSPDGRTLAVSGFSGLTLWDLDRGLKLRFIPFRVQEISYNRPPGTAAIGPSSRFAARGRPAFSPDGKYVASLPSQFEPTGFPVQASGRPAQLPDIWAVDSGEAVGSPKWIWTAADRTIVNNSLPWTMADLAKWRNAGQAAAPACQTPGPRGPELTTSRDGRWCATLSNRRELKVFNGETGVPQATRVRQPDGQTVVKEFNVRDMTNSTAFSPDGEWLAVSADEGISLFTTSNMTRVRLLKYESTGFTIKQMVFTPDSTKLITDVPMKVWDVKTGAALMTLSSATRRATALAFSPDGKRLAVAAEHKVDETAFSSGEQGGKVTIWDLAAGGAPRVAAIHRDAISSMAFTRDGVSLLVGSSGTARAVRGEGQQGEVKLWNVNSARATFELAAHSWESSSNGVAVSPDGRVLAALVFPFTPVKPGQRDEDRISAFTLADYDAVIRRWNAVTGKRVPDIPIGHADVGGALAISPDGARVAAVVNDEVSVWTMAAGTLVRRFGTGINRVTAGAWLPDSRRFIVAGDRGELEVRDALTGDLTHTLSEESGKFQALSVDGNGRIAAGDCEGVVRVWDSRDWRLQFRSVPHDGCVTALAFSSDGQLASAGEDGVVRLWDSSGRWRALLSTLGNSDQWIVIGPDGRYDGTPSLARTIVAFRQGRTAWPPESFRGATRTPNLLPLLAR